MEKIKIEQGTIKVKEIVPNPNNPRSIKAEQLTKLKKSITEFPDMLALRPLVIDENNIVIGGNMRLKAMTDLGIDETPYIKVFNLDEDKRKEFLIKDNLNYGEWDWDSLKTDWNFDSIQDWGLDIPKWMDDEDVEPEFDTDTLDEALNKYINGKIKQIICYFDSGDYQTTVKQMEYVMKTESLENHTQVLIHLLGLYGKTNRLSD